MDGESEMPGDLDVTRVQDRLEETRRHIGDTVEALVYKTDVPARASDVVKDGVAAAKENLASASGVAASQAAGVAATIFETVETAKATTADIAVVANRNVPEIVRANAWKITGGFAILAVLALVLRRRRSHTVIDESPEVQKARELVD